MEIRAKNGFLTRQRKVTLTHYQEVLCQFTRPWGLLWVLYRTLAILLTHPSWRRSPKSCHSFSFFTKKEGFKQANSTSSSSNLLWSRSVCSQKYCGTRPSCWVGSTRPLFIVPLIGPASSAFRNLSLSTWTVSMGEFRAGLGLVKNDDLVRLTCEEDQMW